MASFSKAPNAVYVTYFLLSHCRRYVKIGCTNNPKRRLAELRWEYHKMTERAPKDVTFKMVNYAGFIPGGRETEIATHQRFAEYSTVSGTYDKNEWFYLRGDLVRFILEETSLDYEPFYAQLISLKERDTMTTKPNDNDENSDREQQTGADTMTTKTNGYEIESKYGVAIGDDWLTVAMEAPFKRGQRVVFRQTATTSHGVVLDTRRMVRFGALAWEILVKYDDKAVARWTAPKWLTVDTRVVIEQSPQIDLVAAFAKLETMRGDGIEYGLMNDAHGITCDIGYWSSGHRNRIEVANGATVAEAIMNAIAKWNAAPAAGRAHESEGTR